MILWVDIYADDTSLSTSAVVSDLIVIQQRLQDDINKIEDWISDNKMLLFRRLDWLPLKEELNLKRASLIFRGIKDENNSPSYITKLLTIEKLGSTHQNHFVWEI